MTCQAPGLPEDQKRHGLDGLDSSGQGQSAHQRLWEVNHGESHAKKTEIETMAIRSPYVYVYDRQYIYIYQYMTKGDRIAIRLS